MTITTSMWAQAMHISKWAQGTDNKNTTRVRSGNGPAVDSTREERVLRRATSVGSVGEDDVREYVAYKLDASGGFFLAWLGF